MKHHCRAISIGLLAVMAGGMELGGPEGQAMAAEGLPIHSDPDRRVGLQASTRIFNGSPTLDFPAAGALIVAIGRDPRPQFLTCSATLIGPRTALTAAHCVCPPSAFDGAACQPEQPLAPMPAAFRLFLQHWGGVDIASIGVPSDFCFPGSCGAGSADYAVLNLSETVEGIRPAALAATTPAVGTELEIVGFGNDGDDGSSTGIKRVGNVTTVDCARSTVALEEDEFICWELTAKTGQNTCAGDSGGPALLAGQGDQTMPVLAGTTSGGSPFCASMGFSFDTNVAHFRNDIIARSVGEITAKPAGGMLMGTAVTLSDTFALPSDEERIVHLEVPEITSRIVIVSSGTDPRGEDQYLVSLRRGAEPTDFLFDCRSTDIGVFASCFVDAPQPGTWFGRIQRTTGPLNGTGGEFQLTVTTYQPGTADGLDEGIRVLLEEPRDGKVTTGVSNLRGWAVGPEGIDRVELFVDGQFAFTIPYGGNRKDVAAVFPGLPDASASGFSQAFNYSNLGSGPHLFTVRAVAPDESFNEASSRFTVNRFTNAFIKDPNQFGLAKATAMVEGDAIRVPGVSVEGRAYELRLEWNTATQNFGIVAIDPQ